MRFPRLFKKQPPVMTPPQTVSEIHWREGDATPAVSDAVSSSAAEARQDGPKHAPIYHAPARRAQTVSEIHWRQGDDTSARS